ncbi:MAG: DNA-directed RNA polymerase subunit E'' [Candidatus Lokiarchaeota archaeon]|nr:DNA-directed RNA polymerase subunit E'' [Candidatus Lokiarchaeota archaeon]
MKKLEKACKNCHLITKSPTVCPKCKTHSLSDDYTGEVIIIDPKNSEMANYLNIHFPGKYALRVR